MRKAYSDQTKEPERPIYIHLVKVLEKNRKLSDVQVNKLQEPSYRDFMVFPNPFNNVLQVAFYLPEAADINLKLYDLAGKLLFEKKEKFGAGQQQFIISPEISAGSYLLRLSYNDKTKSTIVIKQ